MKNYIFIKLNYIETSHDESFYNKLLFRHICEIRCTVEFKIVYNGVIVSILCYNIRLTSFVHYCATVLPYFTDSNEIRYKSVVGAIQNLKQHMPHNTDKL